MDSAESCVIFTFQPSFGYYAYDTGPMLGEHGFDPAQADMSGIFTAFGPSRSLGLERSYDMV